MIKKSSPPISIVLIPQGIRWRLGMLLSLFLSLSYVQLSAVEIPLPTTTVDSNPFEKQDTNPIFVTEGTTVYGLGEMSVIRDTDITALQKSSQKVHSKKDINPISVKKKTKSIKPKDIVKAPESSVKAASHSSENSFTLEQQQSGEATIISNTTHQSIVQKNSVEIPSFKAEERNSLFGRSDSMVLFRADFLIFTRPPPSV